MPSNKVKRSGPGAKVLLSRLKNPGTVEVGIIDSEQHADSDLNVASIGYIHEFGSEAAGIPERSFIRSTINGDKKDILALNKSLLKQIQNGTLKMEKALGILGAFVADKVHLKIINLKEPPNKPATIAAKGSSNPLVQHKQLANSITWEVNK